MRTFAVCFLLIAFQLSAQTGRESPSFQVPGTVAMKANLVYARYGAREMHVDLYYPKTGAGPFPAVVWVHGGGWQSGDKTRFRRQAALMAAHGIAGACIEYRLSGEAKFPAAIQDVKASVRWLRAHAGEYHINADKIGAAGGSAGGHLVCLLGVTAGVREFEGDGGNPDQSSKVQAVAALYPVTDFVSAGMRQSAGAIRPVSAFLGASYADNPEIYAKASPITYVSKDDPPFLFLHGDDDRLVPYQQSVSMYEKLKAAGVPAELDIVKGAGHGFANGPKYFQDSLDRMEAFFAKALK